MTKDKTIYCTVSGRDPSRTFGEARGNGGEGRVVYIVIYREVIRRERGAKVIEREGKIEKGQGNGRRGKREERERERESE